MTVTTPEQRAEFKEAHTAALDAVARINALFAATGHPYRAEFHFTSYWPPGAFDDDDNGDAPDNDSPSGTGRERAESEDEGGDV
jgi:hypothetical protein